MKLYKLWENIVKAKQKSAKTRLQLFVKTRRCMADVMDQQKSILRHIVKKLADIANYSNINKQFKHYLQFSNTIKLQKYNDIYNINS